MGFSVAVERITAGDDDIAAALLDAELPALLPALAHATGDLSLLREELRPDPLLINEPQAGFTPEQQDAIRALALGALVQFRDGGCVLAPAADHRDAAAPDGVHRRRVGDGRLRAAPRGGAGHQR